MTSMPNQNDWAQDFWQFTNLHRGVYETGSSGMIQGWIQSIKDRVSLADVPTILHISTESANRYSGINATPPLVNTFVREYLNDTQVDKILDVNAGFGSLLATAQFSTNASMATAFELHPDCVEIGRALNPSANWLAADFFNDSFRTDHSYDLVLGLLPFGFRSAQPVVITAKSGETVEVRRDRGFQLLVTASMQLSDSGLGIFVTTSDFFWSRNSPIRQMPKLGLWIHAALELYPGAFAPHTNISAYVVLVRKQPTPDMFVGRLTRSAETNKRTFENLKSRKAGTEVGYGRLIQPNHFMGIDALQVAEDVKEAERLFGFSAHFLYDLAGSTDGKPITRGSASHDLESADRPNSIYIPRTGVGKVVCSPEHFEPEPRNYLQVDIDPTKSNARFVAEFLNTELGRSIREKSRGGAISSILSNESLKTLRILVPPLDLQHRVLEIGDAIGTERYRLLGLDNELTELERGLWQNPRTHRRVENEVSAFNASLSAILDEQVGQSLDKWMETLPFPLASILRKWYAAPQSNFDLKYRLLVHFFEATTHFMGSILLSGFTYDSTLYEKYRGDFLEVVDTRSLTRTDYGTWHQIGAFFSKRLRILLNSDAQSRRMAGDLFSDQTYQFTDMLASAKLFNVLADANKLRNKWQGHTGLPSHREAEERHDALVGHLHRLRKSMEGGWTNMELIIPDTCKKRRGRCFNEVQLLQGSHPAFQTVVRETSDCLDADEMHLLGKGTDTSLRLLPFIQLGPNPPSPSATCYFYRSVEDGEHRLISFQGSGESEWKDSLSSLDEAIGLIIDGIGLTH